MSVYDYANGNDLLKASAIKDKDFRDFFKNIKIRTVVEIGTHKGISAAHMAQYANKIFTFDIVDFKAKYKVWEELGVKNKIYFYKVKDRSDIKAVLDTIKFDFAFIDAIHDYENVSKDFELVKHCKKVLLHDVKKLKKFYGIKKFCDEIGVTEIGNVAYWRGK